MAEARVVKILYKADTQVYKFYQMDDKSPIKELWLCSCGSI